MSQGELCWRKEELTCRSVCELLDDGGELLERKGSTGCERFRRRETRKVMCVWKCPNAFDKAFICKLVDIVAATVTLAEEAAPCLLIPNLGVTYPKKLISLKQLLFELLPLFHKNSAKGADRKYFCADRCSERLVD